MKQFSRRERLLPLVVLVTVAVVLTCGFLTSSSATQNGNQKEKKFKEFGEKRKLKHRLFDGIPITIKKIKNVDSEEDDWFRTLEIEVENTSDKPIYFLTISFEFLDIPAEGGDVTGFIDRYGSSRLNDVAQIATDEDLPVIKPGETSTFTIFKVWGDGLESIKKRRSLPKEAADNIEIWFGVISFGDGTGFIGGEKRDYRGMEITPSRPATRQPDLTQPPSQSFFQKISYQFSLTSMFTAPIAATAQNGCGNGNCQQWFFGELEDVCNNFDPACPQNSQMAV
ncbi:MAG: hypothetical protein MSG64_11850 [Pyrinomonadaceae bacterium MAG19_C2-C3]|nr:hypothetical protein [Pyrinomonadaceae bacterium MAG19_C2-C3]